MKEGRAREDKPCGKVCDFVGGGQSASGGAGGDAGLHLPGHVGPVAVRGDENLDAGCEGALRDATPLPEDSFESADPGPGEEIASCAVEGEGGKKDKECSVGGEAGPEVIDQADDAGKIFESLERAFRGGVGADEGGMGKKGDASEGAALQCGLECGDPMRLVALYDRVGRRANVPEKRCGLSYGGKRLTMGCDKDRVAGIGKSFDQGFPDQTSRTDEKMDPGQGSVKGWRPSPSPWGRS